MDPSRRRLRERLSGTAPPALAAAVALGLSAAAQAAMTDHEARRLAELSLEELMQVEVTSVAGTGQSRISAPAALTVLSAEDIRRAGHRNLAEALRMVPGMYVGRVNSSSWVVGSRGLTATNITANRYLVLIDGRIAHDPLVSATLWDVSEVLLDDIERIEVIRGPGATLWGANAMNGVISVITRDARDTVGTLARVGYGDYERGFGLLRHGAETPQGAWRAWLRYDRRGDFEDAAGASLEDQWSSLRGGMRADFGEPQDLQWTVSAQGYTHPTAHFSILEPVPGVHQQQQRLRGHTGIHGGHAMVKARRDRDDGSGWSLQAYADTSRRESPRLDVSRDTYDVDFRQWRRWGAAQELIWGVQYDQSSDRVGSSASVAFDPSALTVRSTHAFVQNTTAFADRRAFVMLGTKLTHHDFVGTHLQPAIRAWWTPSETQTWWAAVSRPVRVPSRLEESGALIFGYFDTGLLGGQPPSGVIVPLALSGNPDLDVEKLLAWELGHRIQLGPAWSLETSLFHNDYQRLISVPLSVVGTFNNDGSGRTRGLELVAAWRPHPGLRLDASWSYLDTRIDGPVLEFDENGSPQHLGQVRVSYDLSDDWEVHGALYHVGDIPRTAIPAYDRLDVGVTWHRGPRWEWALWGQNLADGEHPEASGAEVPRSLYLQATLRLD